MTSPNALPNREEQISVMTRLSVFSPFDLVEGDRGKGLVLVADHAGNRIPAALGDLGVSKIERARHIGWDIGIAGVSRRLADALDAVLIQQNYSRLVIDCNRPPAAPSSMPEISELTPVPGNIGLSDADRARRVAERCLALHDNNGNGAGQGGYGESQGMYLQQEATVQTACCAFYYGDGRLKWILQTMPNLLVPQRYVFLHYAPVFLQNLTPVRSSRPRRRPPSSASPACPSPPCNWP